MTFTERRLISALFFFLSTIERKTWTIYARVFWFEPWNKMKKIYFPYYVGDTYIPGIKRTLGNLNFGDVSVSRLVDLINKKSIDFDKSEERNNK